MGYTFQDIPEINIFEPFINHFKLLKLLNVHLRVLALLRYESLIRKLVFKLCTINCSLVKVLWMEFSLLQCQ